MKQSEYEQFVDMLQGVADVYGKQVSPAAVAIWWKVMQPYDLQDVQRGFEAHLRERGAGSFWPKPADVLAHLAHGQTNDPWPTADEAWAIAVRAMDEAETVVWTGPMREAWGMALDVFVGGDEIGARLAFRATYERLVGEARMQGMRPTWEVSPGTSQDLRARRVDEAVGLGRLGDSARDVFALPAPTRGIAGLLDGAREAAAAGAVSFQVEKLERNLQGLRAALARASLPDSGVDAREVKRLEFEAHRAAQLAQVEERLANGG